MSEKQFDLERDLCARGGGRDSSLVWVIRDPVATAAINERLSPWIRRGVVLVRGNLPGLAAGNKLWVCGTGPPASSSPLIGGGKICGPLF